MITILIIVLVVAFVSAIGFMIYDLTLRSKQESAFKKVEEAVKDGKAIDWDMVPEGFNYFCIKKDGYAMFTHLEPTYHTYTDHDDWSVFSYRIGRVSGLSYYDFEVGYKLYDIYVVGRKEGVMPANVEVTTL